MTEKPSSTRYKRLKDLVQLAIMLQTQGATLDEIKHHFGISRRTAERMKDKVEEAFGVPMQYTNVWDETSTKKKWTLRANDLGKLVVPTAEELTELAGAVTALEQAGLAERAKTLRSLDQKIHASLRAPDRIRPDVEALLCTEGLAERPGPRVELAPRTISKLRDAIRKRRWVTFRYDSRTGEDTRRSVRPLGILYGNRPMLVAALDNEPRPRLWRLQNMRQIFVDDETFERASDFDLAEFARQSFGVFQEDPVDVVLRFDKAAAADASDFVFHPSQEKTRNDDGSLTVRFSTGGVVEMCLHLFGWGDAVTIEAPATLREKLVEMATSVARHHQLALGNA